MTSFIDLHREPNREPLGPPEATDVMGVGGWMDVRRKVWRGGAAFQDVSDMKRRQNVCEAVGVFASETPARLRGRNGSSQLAVKWAGEVESRLITLTGVFLRLRVTSGGW